LVTIAIQTDRPVGQPLAGGFFKAKRRPAVNALAIDFV
jgi:hypothetical protein